MKNLHLKFGCLLLGLVAFQPIMHAQSAPKNIPTSTVLTEKKDGYPVITASIGLGDQSNYTAFDSMLYSGYRPGVAIYYRAQNNPNNTGLACVIVFTTTPAGSCEWYGASGTNAYYLTAYFTGMSDSEYNFEASQSNSLLIIP